ncbi:hypothetical protein L9F63_004871, partial [Diploptera punctata]
KPLRAGNHPLPSASTYAGSIIELILFMYFMSNTERNMLLMKFVTVTVLMWCLNILSEDVLLYVRK